MNTVPLSGHVRLDEIFAWRPAGPVSVRTFLAEVTALASGLPGGRQMLNVCEDRYRFTVGLAAGLITGKTSLQPASLSAETLRQIKLANPEAFCLCDSDFDSRDLPRVDYAEPAAVDAGKVTKIPRVPADLTAVQVYTSGSTGQPVPHRKSWGALVRNAQAEATRLGLIGAKRHAIVGTVPAQHMFGFESTVLLTLHGNGACWSGKPFFPQDIVGALQSVPRPRLLVTTPFHLATLLSAGIALPEVDLLLSATAPLSDALAQEAEQRFGAPLDEIYGCTETGQLATRRTTEGRAWHPLDAIRLRQEGDITFASGGHVEGEVALSDAIELLADGRFILHGRHADLVNIAGKRTSLAYLNHQITAIEGVRDATFFLPDESTPGGVTRLCAFVVAPGLSNQDILQALRERIDPIFLPRPLVIVDTLPRNRLGKLPRTRLDAMYLEAAGASHA